MKRVLISGSSGYFGGLASLYLRDSGIEVLSSGRGADTDLRFDLDEPEAFAQGKIDRHIDAFIHAAATNEVDCKDAPYRSVYRNVAGTRAALDFCVNNGIRDFYYLSTFHVYGAETGVVNENTPPHPVHDYGLTHLQAEEYVRLYTRKGWVNGVSLRPSNMFDIPASLDTFNRWSLIPFAFCRSAVEESRIVLKTPGYQQRNFVSVRDIVKIIHLVDQGEIKADIVNVPGVSTLSIRQFATLVKTVMQERFGRAVDIEVPEGVATEDRLDYQSRCFSPDALNFSKIDDYVHDFCAMLLANG